MAALGASSPLARASAKDGSPPVLPRRVASGFWRFADPLPTFGAAVRLSTNHHWRINGEVPTSWPSFWAVFGRPIVASASSTATCSEFVTTSLGVGAIRRRPVSEQFHAPGWLKKATILMRNEWLAVRKRA